MTLILLLVYTTYWLRGQQLKASFWSVAEFRHSSANGTVFISGMDEATGNRANLKLHESGSTGLELRTFYWTFIWTRTVFLDPGPEVLILCTFWSFFPLNHQVRVSSGLVTNKLNKVRWKFVQDSSTPGQALRKLLSCHFIRYTPPHTGHFAYCRSFPALYNLSVLLHPIHQWIGTTTEAWLTIYSVIGRPF